MKTGVVLVAAGRGERLGYRTRKAMVPLGDRPLVLHAALRLAGHPRIDEVVLVIHPDDAGTLQGGPWSGALQDVGLDRFVAGGERRQDSVRCGLEALSSETAAVLVHDAARPFVTAQVVDSLIDALEEGADAAIPVVAVTSTVKRVGSDSRVDATVPRDQLRLAQTPQACRRDVLIRCLEQADREGREVTDESQALESAGYRVCVVSDSPWNFKVTTPDDLALAELVHERGIAK